MGRTVTISGTTTYAVGESYVNPTENMFSQTEVIVNSLVFKGRDDTGTLRVIDGDGYLWEIPVANTVFEAIGDKQNMYEIQIREPESPAIDIREM